MKRPDYKRWIEIRKSEIAHQKYWERHATAIFFVVLTCILLSTRVQSLTGYSSLVALASGVVFFLGVRLEACGRLRMGYLVMAISTLSHGLLAFTTVHLTLALFVVQVSGFFVIGYTGAELIRQRVRKQ